MGNLFGYFGRLCAFLLVLSALQFGYRLAQERSTGRVNFFLAFHQNSLDSEVVSDNDVDVDGGRNTSGRSELSAGGKRSFGF